MANANIQLAINKAKELIRDNFVIEPPVDVYEIAQNSGLRIVEEPFPDDISDVSGFIDLSDDKAVMYINANDAPNRRKFTVAHELGHWILHREQIKADPQKTVLLRMALGVANQDPFEKEANAFAAELLVPMELFQTEENDKSVAELAELFQVSSDVIGFRKMSSSHARRNRS